MDSYPEHYLRIQGSEQEVAGEPTAEIYSRAVRTWLTAIGASEHLSLLVGSGLGIGISSIIEADGLDMGTVEFKQHGDLIQTQSEKSSARFDRGAPNFEDQVRSALQLLGGLEILEPDGESTVELRKELGDVLYSFANKALKAEREIKEAVTERGDQGVRASQVLVNFLLAFAHRAPSRERLHLFTTNYDRLLEFGADLGGLRVLDRFAGAIEPVFRASRLDLDLHYNPPGIRGEPRFVEGVFRLSKLHGSLDWEAEETRISRVPLAFGADELPRQEDALERLMIYPNASKDTETLFYPYAELFRDFSAATCRPNSALVTYGYGFGDDHVNRVLRDMLSLPSTHLVVIAFGDPENRVKKFVDSVSEHQVSVMIGPHFGHLETLVDSYLPQPGTEALQMQAIERAQRLGDQGGSDPESTAPAGNGTRE